MELKQNSSLPPHPAFPNNIVSCTKMHAQWAQNQWRMQKKKRQETNKSWMFYLSVTDGMAAGKHLMMSISGLAGE